MTFTPTHTVPGTGLRAWTTPDPNAAPAAQLDPRLPVQVLQTWGSWAQVVCSNGWTAWTEAVPLQPLVGADASLPPACPQPGAPQPATAPTPEAYSPPPGGPTGPATYDAAPGSYADAYRQAFPDGRTPAGVTAAGAAGGSMPLGAIAPVLGGAAAIVIGAFLSWFNAGYGIGLGASDIPVQALVLTDATSSGPVNVAMVLIAAAVVAVVAVFLPGWGTYRRIAGWVVVVAATLFVAQLQRSISQASVGPTDTPSLFSVLGWGVYVTMVGGLVVALAPAPSKPTG